MTRFYSPDHTTKKPRGYFGVGLFNPKDPQNIGGVMRAADCYGAAFVSISGTRYEHQAANTTRAEKHMPVFDKLPSVLDVRPYGAELVCIEIVPGATPLPEFIHPKRALYVFGPEDGNTPESITSKAQHVVSVPTRYCMNLASTACVVFYDRQVNKG